MSKRSNPKASNPFPLSKSLILFHFILFNLNQKTHLKICISLNLIFISIFQVLSIITNFIIFMVLLNMNQHIITTLLVTLFIFQYITVTFCINPLYGSCPTASCGSVNITYPFYIVGKQKVHCGYPGFEVSCHNGNIPYVNISGDPYVILHIWYKTQSFQVMNSAVYDAVMNGICITSINNMTLQDSIFRFADGHEGKIILLNCENKSFGSYEHDRLLGSNCNTVALFDDDKGLTDLEKNCSGVKSVPYEGVRNGSSIRDVLRRGILLNWTANNCSACTETGGQCGFNRSTYEFKCYCRDHDHAYHCVPKKKNVKLIAGLSVAGCVIMLALASMAIWYCKKIKFNHSKFVSRSNSLDRTTSNLEKGSIYFGVPLFSYRELQEATDGFNRSRELGDGGFGTVYYGKLKDGREVAVKRLFEKSYKRVEQFMNEVEILTCLRHQNLVSLYGCTSHHSRELLLVYEFVPNGTVADHLFGEITKSRSLPWNTRLRIAIETANALSYLHASDIIHRDVKTTNILLDSSFSVKVADFGLSRLFPNDVTHVSTAPQGTPGYLDPEYHQCYQLTDKSDVYSFGVVLIELISSLPAVDMDRHRQEINLSNYAMNRIQRCAFEELVDPKLGYMSDYKVRKMTTAVAELAFQCLQHEKEFRPSMDEALERLKSIETSDYEALEAEELRKKDGSGACSTPPPPSPVEDDDAKLLTTNNDGKPCSPNSVMDKWGSKNTTPNASK